MRHPLLAALALTGILSLACMPPTTYGLRSAGDLAPAGTGGAGVGLGVNSSGFTLVSLDGDYTFNDHLGVAGAIALVGAAGQAQGELRLSTDAGGRLGASGVVGVGGVAGALITAGGPYAGGAARLGSPERGFVYGGGKVNTVFNSGFANTWLSPTVGATTAGRPWRFGGELIYFYPLSGESTYGPSVGGQVFLRRQVGTARPDQ
jgi:hypothetical protein